MSKKNLIIIIIAILVPIFFALVYFSNQENGHSQEKIQAFAECLKDDGAIMYGAFWCSHCQNQKKLFASAEDIVPYVECSDPSGRGQTIDCITAGVSSYPTWEFSDGSRVLGELSFDELSQYTSCSI